MNIIKVPILISLFILTSACKGTEIFDALDDTFFSFDSEIASIINAMDIDAIISEDISEIDLLETFNEADLCEEFSEADLCEEFSEADLCETFSEDYVYSQILTSSENTMTTFNEHDFTGFDFDTIFSYTYMEPVGENMSDSAPNLALVSYNQDLYSVSNDSNFSSPTSFSSSSLSSSSSSFSCSFGISSKVVKKKSKKVDKVAKSSKAAGKVAKSSKPVKSQYSRTQFLLDINPEYDDDIPEDIYEEDTYEEDIYWIAALQNDLDAMYALAQLYEKKQTQLIDDKDDKIVAYGLYEIAARKGHLKAKTNLKKLKKLVWV